MVDPSKIVLPEIGVCRERQQAPGQPGGTREGGWVQPQPLRVEIGQTADVGPGYADPLFPEPVVERVGLLGAACHEWQSQIDRITPRRDFRDLGAVYLGERGD